MGGYRIYKQEKNERRLILSFSNKSTDTKQNEQKREIIINMEQKDSKDNSKPTTPSHGCTQNHQDVIKVS